MMRVLLSLCCAGLLGCNGDKGATDLPRPGDTSVVREVSSSEGLARTEGPQRDRPQPDQGGKDRAATEARAPDLARDLKQPDNKPWPDKPPTPPPDPCRTNWGLWSCVPMSNGCSATCGTYGMTCMQIGLAIQCTCKHGAIEKYCKTSGTSCSMCSGAVAQGCCNF